jgi:hypothetical protein
MHGEYNRFRFQADEQRSPKQINTYLMGDEKDECFDEATNDHARIGQEVWSVEAQDAALG